MSIRALFSMTVLSAGLLLGQLSPNTVTVTASQSPTSQPDQALFSVTINSGVGQSLGDIVNAAAGVGISAANLTGVSFQSNPPAAPQLQWSFQLPVALSMLKQTTASLAALQKAIAQGNSGLSLSFSVQGVQDSGQQTASCDFGALISSARAQAQQMAGTAGMPLGRIAGLSGAISQGVGNCSATVTFGLGYSGNPGPHTIAITASRTQTSVVDQVVIEISLSSSAASGLDDVTSMLARAGISGASLSSVVTSYTYDAQGNQSPYLQWSFTLSAPLATLKNTIAQLTAAQVAVANQNSGLACRAGSTACTGLSFSIGNLQTSTQAQPVCSQSALVSDATAQAQALAGAAGVSVGPISSMSMTPIAAQAVIADTFAFQPVTTILGYANFLVGSYGLSTSTPPPSCSLEVQFLLY